MALYLGESERLKIVINNVVYKLNLYTETPILNNIKLLSSDNLILLDANGVYLTVKESD